MDNLGIGQAFTILDRDSIQRDCQLTRRSVDSDVDAFGNCLKAETAVVKYPLNGMRNYLNGLLEWQLSIIELTKDSIEVFP